jgi:hypothetical protein
MLMPWPKLTSGGSIENAGTVEPDRTFDWAASWGFDKDLNPGGGCDTPCCDPYPGPRNPLPLWIWYGDDPLENGMASLPSMHLLSKIEQDHNGTRSEGGNNNLFFFPSLFSC